MSKLSLYDLVGDLVLYRNLDPVDARLPQFADAWAEIGLADATRPRKHEASYARTTAWYLRRARALDRRAPELAELVYLGDTAMADGNAFKSLRAVTGWPGWAFEGEPGGCRASTRAGARPLAQSASLHVGRFRAGTGTPVVS